MYSSAQHGRIIPASFQWTKFPSCTPRRTAGIKPSSASCRSFTALFRKSELSHLYHHLEMVTIRAEHFSQNTVELTSLDCQFAEPLLEKFSSTKMGSYVGTQTGKCSGAAFIWLTCTPWRANVSIRSQAEDKLMAKLFPMLAGGSIDTV